MSPAPGRSRRFAAVPALFVGALLVLGVYNLGARHAEYEATVHDFVHNGFHLDGRSVGRAVRMYLTDDGDVRRYYAYANALLGRPYYGYFVRSAAQWDAEFAAPVASSPEDWPLQTPAAPLVPYRDYLIEYPPGLLLFTVPPALLLPSGDYGELYRLLFCSEMALLLGLAAWLGLRARAELVKAQAPVVGVRAPLVEVQTPLMGAHTLLIGVPLADAQASVVGAPGPLPGVDASPVRAQALAGRAVESRFLWLCALGALLVGPIATHRYDAVVAVLLCLTAWAALSGRVGLAGAALMLAVASKGVPLLGAPIWVAYVWLRPAVAGGRAGPRGVGQALGWALLAGAAVVIPILLWCGWAPLQALRYHSVRPLQIESTGAALLGLGPAFVPSLRPALQVVSTYGSWNVVPVGPALAGVDAVLQRLSTGLLGAGILVMYGVTVGRLRGLRRTGARNAAGPLAAMGECALRSQVAVLVLYMVLGKVFSPQYVIWLLPLGLLVALRERRLLVLVLVAMGLTQVIHPICYAALKDLRPWACGLVLLRNLTLLAFALHLLGAPKRGAACRQI